MDKRQVCTSFFLLGMWQSNTDLSSLQVVVLVLKKELQKMTTVSSMIEGAMSH